MANAIIIKELIEKLETNVSRFERDIGVGASTISKAIKRNSKIDLDITQKILDKFQNVSKDWLLTGEGEMLLSSDYGEAKELYKAVEEPANKYGEDYKEKYFASLTKINQLLEDQVREAKQREREYREREERLFNLNALIQNQKVFDTKLSALREYTIQHVLNGHPKSVTSLQEQAAKIRILENAIVKKEEAYSNSNSGK